MGSLASDAARLAPTGRIVGDRAGTALSLGFVTTFLTIMVVLPIAALVAASGEDGWRGFWEAISSPGAVAALKLTVAASFVVSLINAVLGTVTAWVLVRDDFRGKALMNAIIDLPFALPTIVAGLTLLALYGPKSPIGIDVAYTRTAIVLALMFVTLPFVVRTVQPVLRELDLEMEQAAKSLGASEGKTFRRVILPNILPGILSGVALAFAQGGRRVRLARDHHGQPPVQDRGLLRLHLRPHRERRRDRGGGHRGRAARHLVRGAALDRSHPLLHREARSCVGSTEHERAEASASPTPERRNVRRLSLRLVAIVYLLAILVGPLTIVFWRTFEDGFGPAWEALSNPDTIHAFKLTLIITVIAVPVNTVFGIVCALAIVRRSFPGKGLLNAFIDLPLALSPVVVGLALYLLYGRDGWFGGWLDRHDIQFLFALPSMIVATIFVSLPFVAREVIPTLREIGDEQEQAAQTLGAGGWQTFWRITLPSIRWAVIYGVILTTARCLGEYGAVAVVSGRLQGQTETATLRVQEAYESFDLAGAYAISIVLALIAILVLVLMTVIRPREEHA